MKHQNLCRFKNYLDERIDEMTDYEDKMNGRYCELLDELEEFVKAKAEE
jgi:hypothetical protein